MPSKLAETAMCKRKRSSYPLRHRVTDNSSVDSRLGSDECKPNVLITENSSIDNGSLRFNICILMFCILRDCVVALLLLTSGISDATVR